MCVVSIRVQDVAALPAVRAVAVHGALEPLAVVVVQEDLDTLTSVADNIAGRTICALGDAAALPVKRDRKSVV